MSDDIQAILDRAAARGAAKNLPYAGLVTPAEAWALHQQGAGRIVDVRTEPEWLYVGRIPETEHVEWRAYLEQEPNPAFLAELEQVAPKGEVVMLLCRSAVRSHSAATLAVANGWTKAFNILEGFEGDLDEHGKRGTKGGWRKAGLPWVQS